MRSWSNSAYILITLCIGLVACEDPAIPKPEGFMRIGLLNQEYTTFKGDIPCSFDLSENAIVDILSSEDNSARFNIEYPYYKAKIHMAYNKIEGNLGQYLEETRKLTYQHHQKANNIEKIKIIDPENDVYGISYKLSGDVASSSQFFMTDSTNHFVRGALYFWAKPNEDSLAPVVEHIRYDIEKMFTSFKWKGKN